MDAHTHAVMPTMHEWKSQKHNASSPAVAWAEAKKQDIKDKSCNKKNH